MAGALSFSPILKIGPYPTPGTPWINAEPPRSASLRRAVATPRELSASAWVAILRYKSPSSSRVHGGS